MSRCIPCVEKKLRRLLKEEKERTKTDKAFIDMVVAERDKLRAENKALREVYKHARGLCMGIDWNQGTAAQHHRDELENAVEEAGLLLNTKEEL